jgi:NADPH2:quinone reductase
VERSAAPIPGAGEVIIDVHPAALNRADLLQRAGTTRAAGVAEWMGLMLQASSHTRPKGVVARETPDTRCWGGWLRRQVAVPAEMVLPVPRGLSMVEAAAIPRRFATAT